MKQNNRKLYITIFTIIILLFFFISCSDMMHELKQAIVEVHIDTTPFIEGTRYKVSVNQNGRATSTNTMVTTDSSLQIKPIPVGKWNIVITAILNEEIVGEGETLVDVKEGVTATEPIVLSQAKSRLTSISFGSVLPEFEFFSETLHYTGLTVDYGVSKIKIDASTPSNSTITVCDKPSSDYIDLAVGENEIRVVVCEECKIGQEYTFIIKREEPKIGAMGEAGGYIFYDKGTYSNGWRYLEAASFGWFDGGEDPSFYWGENGAVELEVDHEDIGFGRNNTDKIILFHENKSSNTYTPAAKICNTYSLEYLDETYSDWFLPSKDELYMMHQNLYVHEIGGFSDGGYWSSSVKTDNTAVYQVFDDKITPIFNSRSNHFRVRPIRVF